MATPLLSEKSKWDEDLQPWLSPGDPPADLGVSQWMSVKTQWAVGIVIPVIAMSWAIYYSFLPTGIPSWVVPLVLFALSMKGFYGFLSYFPLNPKVKKAAIINYVCLGLSIATGSTLQYIIGSSCSAFFVIGLPVFSAIDKGTVDPSKTIVNYEWYYFYSWNVGPGVGLFNLLAYWLSMIPGAPSCTRWVLTCFVVPTLLSFLADIKPLLKGGKSIEYNLNLSQSVRLALYRWGMYVFIFYGICYKMEEVIISQVAGNGALVIGSSPDLLK